MTDKSFMNGWSQMPFSAMDSQFDEPFLQNLNDGYYEDIDFDQIFNNEEEEGGEKEEEEKEEEKEEDRETFLPKTYSWNHFLEG